MLREKSLPVVWDERIAQFAPGDVECHAITSCDNEACDASRGAEVANAVGGAFADSGVRAVEESNEAFKLGVNYIIYALTH